jgi:hypothetical protein
MLKKIIFLFLIIILLGGGFFYYWRSQENVRALNKTLPKGVKVEKSLLGNYKVVNKIDGYEFEVPKVWGGVDRVEYISEREEGGFKGTSMYLEGRLGIARVVSIDAFSNDNNKSLRQWADSFFTQFGLVGTFEDFTIKNLEALKTKENEHLGGAFVYFVKIDKKIYVFNGGSEEFIKEIILGGKW